MTDGRWMIGSKTRFETSVYKTHKNGIMISAAKIVVATRKKLSFLDLTLAGKPHLDKKLRYL